MSIQFRSCLTVLFLGCRFCSKSFKNPNTLKNHEASHLNLRLHECTECSIRFNIRSGLSKHIRNVHPKLDFPCDLCSKSYKCTEYLRKHQKLVHSSTKPFVCDLCAKVFPTIQSIKNHMSYSHIERQFSCGKCKSKFHYLSEMKHHLKKKHGITFLIDDGTELVWAQEIQ